MATLGFGAVLAMMSFRRSGHRTWLVLSFLLLTLAVFTKYTAVLFLPAIAWAWLGNRNRIGQPSSWAKFGAYVAPCANPSAATAWIFSSSSTY